MVVDEEATLAGAAAGGSALFFGTMAALELKPTISSHAHITGAASKWGQNGSGMTASRPISGPSMPAPDIEHVQV